MYAYTGARLAAGVIAFEEVGPQLEPTIVRLRYQQPQQHGDDGIVGNITHVEMPFGNIVTNIPKALVDTLGILPGDDSLVLVEISAAGKHVFEQRVPYVPSFGYVEQGAPLLYSDSLQTMGLAVNSGNFAELYEVGAGTDWTIRLIKSPPTE